MSATDSLFKSLSRAISDILRESSGLVRVGSDVSFGDLVRHLGCRVGVVTCEDLVSPLGLLKLLNFAVGDEDGSLGLLTLSVIELEGCLLLRVGNCQACLLETMLAHSAYISELHGRVVTVLGELVTLGAEVNVAQTALVRSLLSNLHLC